MNANLAKKDNVNNLFGGEPLPKFLTKEEFCKLSREHQLFIAKSSRMQDFLQKTFLLDDAEETINIFKNTLDLIANALSEQDQGDKDLSSIIETVDLLKKVGEIQSQMIENYSSENMILSE